MAKANKTVEYRRMVVELLAMRDGWECHYCFIDMTGWLDIKSTNIIIEHKNSGDHLRTDPHNLVLACNVCNAFKKDTPYDEYIERITDNPPIIKGVIQYAALPPLTPFGRYIATFVANRQPQD